MIATNARIVYNRLPLVGVKVRAEVAKHVQTAAFAIEAGAKLRVPPRVDTGQMMASIEAFMVTLLHWRVRIGVHYGIYHEMGTRFMAAHPMLVPSFRAVVPGFLASMSRISVRGIG